MSNHYDHDLVFGYTFKFDDVLNKYKIKRKPKYHMEPRWDPKTGKQVASVKVIDKEYASEYKINDKTFGDWESVLDEICIKGHCRYMVYGDNFDEMYKVIFMPVHNYTDDVIPYKFLTLRSTQNKIRLLGRYLSSLGFDVVMPEVLIATVIS